MKNKFTKAKIGRHNYKSQIEDNIYKMLGKLEEITEIIFQEENTKIIEVKESLYLWGTYLTLGITQVNKEEEWEEEVQGLRKNIKRLDELYNLNTWIQDAEQKETTKTQINKILQLRPSLFCLNRLKPACKMGDISLSLANQNEFADQSADTTHRQSDAAASPTK